MQQFLSRMWSGLNMTGLCAGVSELQTGVDDPPESSAPGLLHSHLQCSQSMTSSFHQSSSPGCAVTQSQHVWLDPGTVVVRCRRRR